VWHRLVLLQASSRVFAANDCFYSSNGRSTAVNLLKNSHCQFIVVKRNLIDCHVQQYAFYLVLGTKTLEA
jgi:hypothetical protein